MANSRDDRNNTVKGRARAYQAQHPGTKYTAARAKILHDSELSVFHELLGQPEAREKLEALLCLQKFENEAQRRGIVPPRRSSVRGLVFTGPPGTGKSSAARLLFTALELPGTLAEAGRYSLVGQRVGTTSAIVRNIVKNIQGGMLVVDGAGDFATQRGILDPFGREAVMELVQALDEDQCTVVLTDQDSRITALMETYPFLRGYFPTHIPFIGLDTATMVTLVKKYAHQYGVRLSDDALTAFTEKVDKLHAQDAHGRPLLDLLGNARFARDVMEYAFVGIPSFVNGFDGDLSMVPDEDFFTISKENMSTAMDRLVKHVVS